MRHDRRCNIHNRQTLNTKIASYASQGRKSTTMMSHSNPQPQKRRLQFLNQQLNEHPESSLSSSQTHQTNSSCSIQFQTPITTSAGRPTHKLFLASSDHHQQSDKCENQIPPVSCCFNVSSRRWSRLKLGCSEVSSMVSQVESAVLHSTSEVIKKKITGQQKREELEREVSKLQKLLDQEEKVHEILEMVHNRPNGSATSIPNFLPPKTKELLAELVMVESEIARLENQISQIQAGLEQEQGFHKEAKLKTWNQGNLHNSNSHLSVTEKASLTSPLHRSIQETTAFETEVHFINKAMKGDRNLGDFCLNEKTAYLRNFVEQKEKHCREDNLMFQDGLPRKSAILKHASPLRDPYQYDPSSKLREHNQEMYLDLPTKSLLDPLLSEENNLKWQPNKLSESIMKCLNFIYVRLLRTSRTMELEKSALFSRSIQSSLSSRSFRIDTSSNPKSSLMLQRESRQQDPYGIFDTEESIPRDIGPYKNLTVFTSSSMDPKFISNPSSIPLLRKLRVLMINLQTVDLRSLTYQQKLAFWINMYNACIMHLLFQGFIQCGVPSNPEKLLALMNKATLNVGGHMLNALAIEHFILRKQAASNMKEVHLNGEWKKQESDVRELYGLESMDPNVTFALCCGTRSSPAVRIYTADGVAAELERSKLDYLQASIMVTSTRRIAFPELLLKSMLDFAKDKDSLVEWVCHQLPTSGTLRKSMVDCFKSHHNTVKASSIVEKIPYDYEFQYLLTI